MSRTGARYRNMEERLLARSVMLPNGCWLWMGRVEPNGYARIGVYAGGGRAAPGRGVKNVGVHRMAYETFKCASIPDGYHVDHRCREPLCINPAHLEAVPAPVNAHTRAKKTRGANGRYA